MNSKIVGHILIITIINPQIDALNLNSFKENLEKEISQNKKIILDFSNVKFVDSSGLGIILSMNRDLGQRDTQIALCAMNQAVETLFEMVKLPQIIPCFSTVDEGLSFFNKGL